MELSRAKEVAGKMIEKLEQYCEERNGYIYIEVVGSVRREKLSVDDIDILLAPKIPVLFDLMLKIASMGGGSTKIAAKKTINTSGINVELWFATLDNWSVMLLIRTGGERSNKRIAELCKMRNWSLSVSQGKILDENGLPLRFFDDDFNERGIEKEEDVYKALNIPYLTPQERE